IIDTPDYTDFTVAVKSAMKVMDTALIVVNSSEGVEAGTEIANEYASEFNISRFFIVNKVDYENSKFDRTVEQLKDNYGSSIILVQFPVNEGLNFDSVVDLIKMKLLKFKRD